MFHTDRVVKFELRKGYVLRLSYRAAIWKLELTNVQTCEQVEFKTLEALQTHLAQLIEETEPTVKRS